MTWKFHVTRYNAHLKFLQSSTKSFNSLHVEVISRLIKDEEIGTAHKHNIYNNNNEKNNNKQELFYPVIRSNFRGGGSTGELMSLLSATGDFWA